ncbi:MAG: HrpE/YscL family type III secretion apparatus protein, partial [Simkania negevensis]|nr:HrpE/YscL family type III secretion apparatus protein [Simkania negevensis]
FSLEDREDIAPGGCIIETEAGIINASLANQWQALEAAFAAFMGR